MILGVGVTSAIFLLSLTNIFMQFPQSFSYGEGVIVCQALSGFSLHCLHFFYGVVSVPQYVACVIVYNTACGMITPVKCSKPSDGIRSFSCKLPDRIEKKWPRVTYSPFLDVIHSYCSDGGCGKKKYVWK